MFSHMAQWIRHLVKKCFEVKSSGGCRFNPTTGKNNKECLTLVLDHG